MEHSENLMEMNTVKEPKVQVKRKKMDAETAQKMNKEMLVRRGSARDAAVKVGAVVKGKEEKKEMEEKKEAEKIRMDTEVKNVEIKIEKKEEGEIKEKVHDKPEIIFPPSNEILQGPGPLIFKNSVETVTTSVDLILTGKSEIEIEVEKVILMC
jgi:hypothetical protein